MKFTFWEYRSYRSVNFNMCIQCVTTFTGKKQTISVTLKILSCLLKSASASQPLSTTDQFPTKFYLFLNVICHLLWSLLSLDAFTDQNPSGIHPLCGTCRTLALLIRVAIACTYHTSFIQSRVEGHLKNVVSGFWQL